MRTGLLGLAAVFLGAFSAHFLLRDRGYVLINFAGYVIEMSVPALLVLLTLGYVVIRAMVALWRAPRRLGKAFADGQLKRSGAKLTRGLIHIAEGKWSKGERLLTQGLQGTGAPRTKHRRAGRRGARLTGPAH